jgi:hypothetical protein
MYICASMIADQILLLFLRGCVRLNFFCFLFYFIIIIITPATSGASAAGSRRPPRGSPPRGRRASLSRGPRRSSAHGARSATDARTRRAAGSRCKFSITISNQSANSIFFFFKKIYIMHGQTWLWERGVDGDCLGAFFFVKRDSQVFLKFVFFFFLL